MLAATVGLISRAKTLVSARSRVSATYASAPRPLGSLEVEPSLLTQHRDELKAALGLHDLAKSGIDRVPERPGSKDRGGFTHNVLVNLNGCLRHGRRRSTLHVERGAWS